MNAESETLQTYLPLRESLSREEFVQRFNHPFLMQEMAHGDEGDELDEKEGFDFRTQAFNRPIIRSPLDGRPAGDEYLVRKVVKCAANPFQSKIIVGRATNSDIVLDFQPISKFHAFFMKEPDVEVYSLTDAESKNGTYLDGQKLEPNQKVFLSEGAVISFSQQVEMLYYSPQDFYDRLARL